MAETFDPADYTVDGVNEYLESADAAERQRVLDAEREGSARKGVLEGPYGDQGSDPAPKTQEAASEPLEGTQALEAAVEKGYLGERFDQTPQSAYTLEGVTTSDEAARADASPHSPTADGPPTLVHDGTDETAVRPGDVVDGDPVTEGAPDAPDPDSQEG